MSATTVLFVAALARREQMKPATLPLKLIYPVIKALVATNAGKLVVLASLTESFLSPGFIIPGVSGLYPVLHA